MRRTFNSACPTTAKVAMSADTTSSPPATTFAIAKIALLTNVPVAISTSSSLIEFSLAWLHPGQFASTSSDLPYKLAFPRISFIAWIAASLPATERTEILLQRISHLSPIRWAIP
jgi:hypothetical protein